MQKLSPNKQSYTEKSFPQTKGSPKRKIICKVRIEKYMAPGNSKTV